MSMKNNSKYYYLSNQNMSEVKESIEEYSMNYDKQSNANSKYHQSISEDIQYSKTNKLASQSLADKGKSKMNIKISQPPAFQQPPNIKQISSGRSEHPDQVSEDDKKSDRPINLGFQVWETIQERYFQTNKISTDDPDVLYDFFISQKKTIKPRSQKVLQEEYSKLQKLMPSMQRKMQIKLDFERMLIFKPNDVLYTLQVAAHMKIKDRQLKKNQVILVNELKKTEKKHKPIKEIVNRLYESKSGNFTKTNVKDIDLERVKLHQFGKKLSEAYQNAMRDLPESRGETLVKLHQFWGELYDREDYGLQWDQQKVEKDIKRYMVEQVEILKAKYQKKIGYSEQNGNKLYKFLVDNPHLPELFIPANSFQGYVSMFNLDRNEKQENMQKIQKQNEQKRKNDRNKSQLKKFGRPVSATPINVLSKPKMTNDYTDFYTKYGNDKVINTIMLEDKVKMHRYPFQYGVYDVVEEIKIKGRVKPNKKEDFDDAINKMLTKTIINQSHFQMTSRMKDRVTDMLREENLHKNDTWKEMAPLLKESMLVKAYEQEWFRDPIVKYLKQTTSKDVSLKQNKYVFNDLFKYLQGLEEDDREDEIAKLQRFISISQSIENKNKEMKNLQNKDQKYYLKERRLMYADLVERAIHFLKLKKEIKQGKSDQKINTRDFMKQTFTILLKSHKDAAQKYFNYVEVKGDDECPALLKYEFYRLLKEINPITFERDEKPKVANWVATKNNPDSFNYKTFNKFANVYKKDKNRLLGSAQEQKRSQSLWGQKKGKERQKLMMTYSDAKECYFHPKVKKLQ